jgi:Mg2+-importing ATPase
MPDKPPLQATDATASETYWAVSAEQLLKTLGSSLGGLAAGEAARRRRSIGPNVLRHAQRAGGLRILLRQFESPLVLILVFAALVAAIARDWTDAAIVLAIVFGSATLGFVQEYRAAATLDALRRRLHVRTTVLRNGRPLTIPSESVVPGDIVMLAAGSLIPADGVLLEAHDFFVIQSALTGESFPVEKAPGITDPAAGLAQRTNCVFMGSSVRSGIARALMVETGPDTVYGKLADRLRLRPPETDFERGIRRYGYLLTQVMLLLVLAVFVTNVLLARPPVESLFFAIALAVGMSPELLPAIITVTLSRGSRAMARRGVIVRRLSAIENLGSMDILCTDKTGTLTVGVMALDGVLDPAGEPSAPLLVEACLNAGLQTGLANPLDEAVVAAGKREKIDLRGYRRLDEVPYDFVRKRLSVVVAHESRPTEAIMIAKGALTSVLENCRSVRDGLRTVPLDACRRAAILALFTKWSAQGYRVLGVGIKAPDPNVRVTRDDEENLTFVGFLLFFDPPKPDARDALAGLARLGVRVKIVTGDNRLVAQHLASIIGLRAEAVLTGTELAQLRDEALWHRAEAVDLFVELDPGQKERVILALKRAGHVVGYLGDGINDATALHAADVGISVDQAVDVAKQAADMVLLQHDLDVLRQGIVGGRSTITNTLKYIFITTSANFGNMLSMAFASLFLPFLPLLAKQILLNNFLSDIPAMAIADDNVDSERIAKPGRWDIRAIWRFMLVFGTLSSCFDFLTFGLLLLVFRAPAGVFRTGWFVESLISELAVLLILRSNRPFWRSRPGRLLWIGVVVVMIFAVTLPYSPVGAPFGFVLLSPALVGAMLGIVVLYAMATELAKFFLWGAERPWSRAMGYTSSGLIQRKD